MTSRIFQAFAVMTMGIFVACGPAHVSPAHDADDANDGSDGAPALRRPDGAADHAPSDASASRDTEAAATGDTAENVDSLDASDTLPPDLRPTHGDAAPTGDDAGTVPSTKDAAATDASGQNPRRVLLCDEGNRRVLLLDLADPTHAIWTTSLNDAAKDGDGMRDMQLVGGDRVAVSTAKGYVELDLETGARKKQVSAFTGVESLRRLPNGHTVLGANANGGVTLQELDNDDAPVAAHRVTFTNYTQFRMLRRTPQGTFLIGVGNKLAEVNWDKQTLWEIDVPASPGHDLNYVYQGVRLPDGTVAVSTGYAASILIVDPTSKTVKRTIGGKGQPDATLLAPNFYGGYHVLPNGHFVVTNWQGHGTGNGAMGVQLLEYDPRGLLVWKWKQTASLVSSLHHVIVLDGLDTSKLHDDVNGVLAPVTP